MNVCINWMNELEHPAAAETAVSNILSMFTVRCGNSNLWDNCVHSANMSLSIHENKIILINAHNIYMSSTISEILNGITQTDDDIDYSMSYFYNSLLLLALGSIVPSYCHIVI